MILYPVCRAVRPCGLAGRGADARKRMHIAGFNRHAVARKPVRHRHVTRCIKRAGFRGKLSAERTYRPLHKPQLNRRCIDYLLIGQLVEYLFHKRPPYGRRHLAAGGAFGQLIFILIRPYPYNCGIISGHAGKIRAAVVRIGAGLSGNGHTLYLRRGTRAAFNGFVQYIHQHISSSGLKHLLLRPKL